MSPQVLVSKYFILQGHYSLAFSSHDCVVLGHQSAQNRHSCMRMNVLVQYRCSSCKGCLNFPSFLMAVHCWVTYTDLTFVHLLLSSHLVFQDQCNAVCILLWEHYSSQKRFGACTPSPPSLQMIKQEGNSSISLPPLSPWSWSCTRLQHICTSSM